MSQCRQFVGLLLSIVACTSALAQQTETKRPTRVRVSQGVIQRNAVEQPQPKYPKKAIEKRLEGLVLFRAVISKEGKIMELELKSGEPILAEAAEKAVKKWRYRPYRLNGELIEVETQITVKFDLKEREPEP